MVPHSPNLLCILRDSLPYCYDLDSKMDSLLLLSTASVLGVLSHHCYFKHGEHHTAAPRIAQIFLVAFISLYLIFRNLGTGRNTTPFAAATCIAGAYAVSLFSSIVIYRLFFHKIKGIPGPLLARVTKLYHVFYALDTKQYLWLDGLEKKYGDFVRTGKSSSILRQLHHHSIPMLQI